MPAPTTRFPAWATSASAVKTAPATAYAELGWVPGTKPPAEYENYLNNLVYQWLDHLAETSSRYDTLHAFTSDVGLAAGDTAVVGEYDYATERGTALRNVAPGSLAYRIKVDGQYVFVTFGTVIRMYDRDLTTVVRTFTYGTASECCSNGDFVAVADTISDGVRCFAISDGATRWTYVHGADVYGVCTDGGFVYLCGAPSAGITVRCLNASTGALVWSYQHSGGAQNVYTIATDGLRVYFGGQASTYASLATMRAIWCANGADATGEGGTGVAPDDQAWNSTGVAFGLAAGLHDGDIATDGSIVAVAEPATSASMITLRNARNGGVLYSIAAADTPITIPRGVAIDDRLVVVVGSDATPNGRWEMIDKRSFARIRRGTLTANPIVSVASDCARLYWCSAAILYNPARGTGPKLWRRVTLTDRYLPYRLMAIPEE